MSDLSVAFKESSPTQPIIVIMSPGTDPVADIYTFADVMGFSEKVSGICLTQRQVSPTVYSFFFLWITSSLWFCGDFLHCFWMNTSIASNYFTTCSVPAKIK